MLCWGCNLRCECAVAPPCPSVPAPTPVRALAGVPVVAVSTGDAHTVALTAAGQALAWGRGAAIGHESDSAAPAPVAGFDDAVDLVSVSCGAGHTVARDAGGGVWVWGAVGGGRDAQGAPARRILASGASAAVAGGWHGLVVVD